MPLTNIQHDFMTNLLQPQNNGSTFLSELQAVGTLPEEKQLEIYRSNIKGAHEKVLGQVYPACKKIVGEDYFNQLCALYRIEKPSKQADLNFYGEQFSAFIQKQIKTQSELDGFEYLVELALLEWHWHTSYFSDDDELFNFKQLAEVDKANQDHIIFHLSHSLSVHETAYPILNMWQANRNIPDKVQEFMMPGSKVFFCISRNNYEVVIEKVTDLQFDLLNSIKNKLSILQLSMLAVDSNDTIESEIMMFIKKGWVTGFSLLRNTDFIQG